MFGARGSANFLSRVTAVLATLFFATSLVLSGVGKPRPEESLLDTVEQAAPVEEEAVPEEDDEDLPELPSLQPAEQPGIPQE